MSSKVHANMSVTLQAYRVLVGSSRHAYHFKKAVVMHMDPYAGFKFYLNDHVL